MSARASSTVLIGLVPKPRSSWTRYSRVRQRSPSMVLERGVFDAGGPGRTAREPQQQRGDRDEHGGEDDEQGDLRASVVEPHPVPQAADDAALVQEPAIEVGLGA